MAHSAEYYKDTSEDSSEDDLEDGVSEYTRFLSGCITQSMFNTWRGEWLREWLTDMLTSSWSNPHGLCDSTTMDFFIHIKMKQSNVVVTKNEPDYLREFCMRGAGFFWCDDCNHQWDCHNATFVIDLHKPEVTKKYKQFCWGTLCDRGCWGELCFTNEQFERIAGRVVLYYKKRKEAGGTVPAFENNGSYSSKAFQAHEELDCERCRELEEPCWLHLVPYIKKIPYEIGLILHSSLSDINELLKKLYARATMEVKDVSKVCRIHINPFSGSESIKQWRKQCETLLDSFLQKFSSVSLSVQTGLSKQMGLPIVKPKPSISVELQTVLHIQM